ncbi:hypothetical protein M7I_7312 [Glarea lozoyensis 74030]|uniref:Uncharacterized protein n=1 Tax=Glarea lozoyensis (strain ATCC 74030 / MF5533) TaxID=1104152 RepID=H0EWY7_GLAL7|nr:hypothetical protein M7I_7312 [Glarea lozoyensis 74030]
MAMPLHFAFGSKGKAFWTASIIGGLSQPAGAGIAAAWFKIAGKNGGNPSEALYGDSLDHANNKTLCTGFAFLGIIIMGMAQALTA